ncbi:hypothetical protein ACFQ0O_36125 [Saccharopolyspora spinosporotrichia]
MSTTEPIIISSCQPNAAGAGVTASARSTDIAMTTTFATVPMPGRCRSGTHSSSTTAPVRAVTAPKVQPISRARPWCSTSQGPRPSPARTMKAMLVP